MPAKYFGSSARSPNVLAQVSGEEDMPGVAVAVVVETASLEELHRTWR